MKTKDSTKKKPTWKFWVSRTFLVIFILGGLWLTNLIWFKPFNIRHFYDKVFIQLALYSPELTTSLGIPVIYDWYKDDLDDISEAKELESFNKLKKDYATLLSYDFANQATQNKLNTKILAFYMKDLIDGEPFSNYSYSVNQMYGIQSSLPSMMESAHKLEDKSDIEAYISRLSKFDTKFDQLIEDHLKISESKGIIPPKFIIKQVLDEMNKFVGVTSDSTSISAQEKSPVTSNILYTNFETKVDKLPDISKADKDNFKNRAAHEIETIVFPAYLKLIAYFEKLNEKATNDAGVWKFPKGETYYRYLLKGHTTLDLDPEEVHQMGLSEISRITKEMNSILAFQNYADSTKSIGEIMDKLNTDERFLFPDTDKGRQMVLDEYDSIISKAKDALDPAFNIRPKAGLEVKRVPEFKQEGYGGAYYNGPAMDGSRGGIFYVNLRSVQGPKYGRKTLAYHEGIPGHHFQIAIQTELKGLPMFKTVIPFTAYSEGWALYAEQLAWELGFYDKDPFGNLGRLRAEIFRAARLVVDTGIHHKKWSREEAIDFMFDNTGMSRSAMTSEVERYIVMPGQACAYKIGMMKILELREHAKTQLGNRFHLKKFHDVVLKNGAVPLSILEEIVQKYIDDTKKNDYSENQAT